MILCCCRSFQRMRTSRCRPIPTRLTMTFLIMTMTMTMTMILSSWSSGFSILVVNAFTTTTSTVNRDEITTTRRQILRRNDHTTFHHHRRRRLQRQKQLFMGGYDATVVNDYGNIQLYTIGGSSFCPYTARTIITLLELGVPYDMFEVNPLPDGSMPDWYLKTINSQGQIPAVRNPSDNNVVVSGSSTIINEYLCNCKYNNSILESKGTATPDNGVSLMPRTQEECDKLRLLNTYYDTIVHPLQRTYFANDNEESKNTKLQEALESTLDYYEDSLSGGDDDDGAYPSSYLIGNAFSLADIHAIPFIHRMIVSLQCRKGYQLDSKRYGKFLQWHETCLQRTSIQTALSSYSDQEIMESSREEYFSSRIGRS